MCAVFCYCRSVLWNVTPLKLMWLHWVNVSVSTESVSRIWRWLSIIIFVFFLWRLRHFDEMWRWRAMVADRTRRQDDSASSTDESGRRAADMRPSTLGDIWRGHDRRAYTQRSTGDERCRGLGAAKKGRVQRTCPTLTAIVAARRRRRRVTVQFQRVSEFSKSDRVFHFVKRWTFHRSNFVLGNSTSIDNANKNRDDFYFLYKPYIWIVHHRNNL